MLSNRTIELVRLQVNVRDVIAGYAKLQQAGSRSKCCCPLHQEKTPSLMIDPARNTWHCFGCGEGGDAIAFIQKKENMDFPEAVRYLASKHHISIEEDTHERTPEEQEQEKQREAMFTAYSIIQKYYVANIHNQDDQARAAYTYALNRWGKDFVEEFGIGFAYDAWDGLINYAKQQLLSNEVLTQLGLIAHSEKSKKDYDFFRARIMIPIRDRYNRIIGYTARTMADDDKTPKYLNSSNSLIYQKSQSVFGIDIAARAAVKDGVYVLVEGAPDVLRLQSIGILNAVASLGSYWTDEQFKVLQRNATKLIFMPDADCPKVGTPYGTGIQKVMKSAVQAWNLGFDVSVKEIPLGQEGRKQDPDSFCKSRLLYDDLETQDFPVWYAQKLIQTQGLSPTEIVDKVAFLLGRLEREYEVDRYINLLHDVIQGKSMWRKAIHAAQQNRREESLRCNDQNSHYLDLFEKYGFQTRGNAYISIGANGKIFQWSNFLLRPLFHISDGGSNALRLFEIENEDGEKRIIEFKAEDLVSLSRFKQKIESIGNYIWLAKEEQLTRLKQFLYKATETAEPITQLGWQDKGFFAFGNGIFDGRTWHKVDDFGIVRLGDQGNFYLPAFSSIYEKQKSLYQFERSFVHYGLGKVTLRTYAEQLIDVFGDNAKIGLSFLLATLFRDVVTAQTKSFPILNLFGPKGSGKSELGHSLMSFFIIENTPPNIQNSTLPALADAVAQCANALVHIDEFKNTIDIDKREFLKGLWDGTGRNRMNMDKDKKREVTRVNSGIILSGQEMATADIALFSRFIFLRYDKSEFTPESKMKFQRLKELRKMGCTHLTMDILRNRALFEAEYAHSYKQVQEDLRKALENRGVEDRIANNWASVLAAFHCLQNRLDMPFTYADLLSIAVEGIMEQNKETKRNNEVATLWDIISFLRTEGHLCMQADYRIETISRLKVDSSSSQIEFAEPKKILYLRYKRVFELYQLHSKKIGESLLAKSSLPFYMEHSPAYLGKKRSFRFKNVIQGYTQSSVPDGQSGLTTESVLDQAYCFDYDMIVEQYGVNLDVVYGLTNEDE